MPQTRPCNPAVMLSAKILCSVRRLFALIPAREKKILVIKSDGLGDFIVWLPYAALLRKHFPADRYRILVWTDDSREDFVKMLPFVDGRVFLRCRSRFQWLFSRLRFWMFQYYDLIINATSDQNDLMIPYGRNNFCVFSRPDKKGFYDASSYCRHVIDVKNMTIHERYECILGLLGILEKAAPVNFLQFAEPYFPGDHQPYFVICPGASDLRRCWEEEKFVALIERLLNLYGQRAVLVGSGPFEKEKCCRIRSLLKHPEKVIDLCGKTSIAQLLSIIMNAGFIVANETGTAHIGGAVGIPSFIICGRGDYGSFVPYPPGIEGKRVFSIFSAKRTCMKCYWKNPVCRKSKVYPCISDIDTDDVFEAISRWMKENRSGKREDSM